MKKIIIIIFSVLISSNLFAIDREDVEKYIEKNFKSVKTIKLDYSDLNNKYNYGYIKAKKGNKYRINTYDRIIVCNGSKIWNYAVNNNKVMISKFDSDRSSLSIENIFFDILKNSKINNFKKEISTNKNNNNLYSVDFTISDSDKSKYKIDKLNVLINEKFDIKQINLSYNGQEQRLKIKSLSINKKINDKEFNFKLPKNSQVIEID